MKRIVVSTVLSSLFFVTSGYSQEIAVDFFLAQSIDPDITNCYKINNRIELPAVIAGAAFTVYNFSRISKKTSSSEAFVGRLKEKNINWFDRWGVRPYSKKIDNASYIPFYVSIPLPVMVFAFDRKMRKDFFKLSFLYAEAITATGILYSSAAGYVNRFRPLAYRSETPIEKRTASDSKKSFFAGHVAVVATSTFFIARVLSDYHPESHYKWVYYSVAGVVTAGTGYMRQQAGEHFLSDILLGSAIGSLSGLLIPSLHRCRLNRSQRLSIFPFGQNGAGFTSIYRL